MCEPQSTQRNAEKAKRRRPGFTLVELLVSMALIVFIMAIVSEAFVAGLETFRQLKATGDMDAKLRTAATLIRRDLRACRLGDSLNDFRRLSEVQLPPLKGFFRIDIGTAAAYTEGTDADGIACTRAPQSLSTFQTNGGDTLHFTVNLSQNDDSVLEHHIYRRENYFSAQITDTQAAANVLKQAGPVAFQGTSTYYSPWGEVAYFIKPSGANTTGTSPQPLYSLYRRQLVVVSEDSVRTALNTGNNRIAASSQSQYYYQFSCKPDSQGKLYFNGPSDLTIPERRFGMTSTAGSAGFPLTGPGQTYPRIGSPPNGDGQESSTLAGSDLLLTDVVSFEVHVFYPGQTTYVDVPVCANPKYPGRRVYDTWSQMKASAANPYDYSKWNPTANPTSAQTIPWLQTITAVHISLRVWDLRTQTTRQMTIVQDM